MRGFFALLRMTTKCNGKYQRFWLRQNDGGGGAEGGQSFAGANDTPACRFASWLGHPGGRGDGGGESRENGAGGWGGWSSSGSFDCGAKAPSLRMTIFVGVRCGARERIPSPSTPLRDAQGRSGCGMTSKKANTGILRVAQNDRCRGVMIDVEAGFRGLGGSGSRCRGRW
jgi:hypothetical protein